MSRKVCGEKIERNVWYGNTEYTLVKAWHYLSNGDRYYYIQVYQGYVSKLVKSFSWSVDKEGKVTML